MDTMTILLMVVIGVIAASQLMQHIGGAILKPYVFWPVELLMVGSAVFVLVAKFSPNAQLDWTIKVFLILFLAWRTLQNYMIRERVRQKASVDEWERKERLRLRQAAAREEQARRAEDEALVEGDEPQGTEGPVGS